MISNARDLGYAWTSSYFSAPKFAASKSPEQLGHSPIYPVVIVGAGPVGLATALLLAHRSIPVVLFDAKDSVAKGSRAICISSRSLEILDQCRILDRLMSVALPWTGGKSFYRDLLVFEFQMATDSDELPPMVNIQQCLLEQMLIDQAIAEPLIDLRWQSRILSLSQNERNVSLRVNSPFGDYEANSAWVIACDGPQSSVRDMLGLKLKGETHDGRYVIVDIHMKSSLPTERLCWFDPPSFPGKTVLMHKQPHDIWRIDYQVDSSESLEAATDPITVLPHIERHLEFMGISDGWELEWLSSYRAHSLTLDSFRRNRVIFAGDAAHLVPIFGVRGLNGGFADAANLSWKLASVIDGADTALLDTYTTEQRGAALANIESASTSAKFMSPSTKVSQTIRNAALSLAITEPEFSQLANPRQTTAASYRNCALSIPDTPTDHWIAGPDPGKLAPNLIIDGTKLQSLADSGPLLLVFGAKTFQLDLPVVQISIQDDEAKHYFGIQETGVYLIRPDRYVAGRWQKPSIDEIRNSLKRLNGFEEASDLA